MVLTAEQCFDEDGCLIPSLTHLYFGRTDAPDERIARHMEECPRCFAMFDSLVRRDRVKVLPRNMGWEDYFPIRATDINIRTQTAAAANDDPSQCKAVYTCSFRDINIKVIYQGNEDTVILLDCKDCRELYYSPLSEYEELEDITPSGLERKTVKMERQNGQAVYKIDGGRRALIKISGVEGSFIVFTMEHILGQRK
ncbi:MAG: hypothetical protein LBR83_01980 [Clostridiales bacterium]|jgi:hypothetical protein|nr:hypothetical protein [Clostridiales bacterium]